MTQWNLEHGHYVYTDEAWFHLPRCHHRLVLEKGTFLENLQFHGRVILHWSTKRSHREPWHSRNLQYRSGFPIYERRIHGQPRIQRYTNLYGRTGQVSRQRIRGTVLEDRQVRRGLSQGIRVPLGRHSLPTGIYELLQFQTPPSVAELPDTQQCLHGILIQIRTEILA